MKNKLPPNMRFKIKTRSAIRSRYLITMRSDNVINNSNISRKILKSQCVVRASKESIDEKNKEDKRRQYYYHIWNYMRNLSQTLANLLRTIKPMLFLAYWILDIVFAYLLMYLWKDFIFARIDYIFFKVLCVFIGKRDDIHCNISQRLANRLG